MKVVISGLGAICAMGENIKALWKAIEQGKSGISPIKRFDVTQFSTQLGAMVPTIQLYDSDEKRFLDYGFRAAAEAILDAEIADLNRVALVLGTCNGLLGKNINAVSDHIAKRLKIGGLVMTVSTACSSSTHAIGIGADLVRRGMADLVLAGGVDILTQEIFAGFHSLGLLSKKPCLPFSIQLGTTLGEGAAFILLESDHSAMTRGIRPVATFLGYGSAADAYHDTSPDPSGRGMSRAIFSALNDACLQAEAIDYINAHGTGTAANDSSEWRAIQRIFHLYSHQLPISSSKSFLGHAQGAAGTLETITTLLAMQNKMVPPTLNLSELRPHSPVDPVAGTKPRSQIVQHALCVNAAFGGNNAALIIGPSDADAPILRKTARTVSISGTGIVMDCDQLNKYVPLAELRGLDNSARLLSASVALTLADAKIRLRTPDCEGIGLFVGQSQISPDSVDAFGKSIAKRGLKNLSASAFTRMVVNYASGACCRLFGLKGPSITVATNPDSGLTALVLSANYLAWHDDTKYLLAAAVDVHGVPNVEKDKAIGILLSTEEEKAPILVAGWGLAHDCDTAIARALKNAHCNFNEVKVISVSGSEASMGLTAVLRAIDALRKNEHGPFLICNHLVGSICAAVILKKRKAHAA